MDKKSLRIELDENEREILIKLKKIFNENTNNAVLRKIINLARDKYL